MMFSRVCGVHRVMPKGGAIDGIIPPLASGIIPYVPIRGFMCSRAPMFL